MDVMKVFGLDPNKDLEMVTKLSKSNGTYNDLMQTVLNKNADFAPFEFGMTIGRKKDFGKKIYSNHQRTNF